MPTSLWKEMEDNLIMDPGIVLEILGEIAWIGNRLAATVSQDVRNHFNNDTNKIDRTVVPQVHRILRLRNKSNVRQRAPTRKSTLIIKFIKHPIEVSLKHKHDV
ncbi:hypothetical protein HanHA89_Chr03g0086881 [Helianthus annuus]|nr:hypothetical protein HanHA89_Chr03g0086881 [Helianthus annuus]